MAHIFKNCLFISGFLLLAQINLLADGRETTIFFNDGSTKKGELLFVRDSVIGLLTIKISDDREIVYYPEKIILAKVNDIRKITLHEFNPSGAVTGSLIGGGVWGAVGLIGLIRDNARGSDPDVIRRSRDEMFSKIFDGAVVGMAVGWLVATFRSQDEITLTPITHNEIRYIYQAARFTGEEPSYLRDSINNLLQEAK